MTTVNVDAVLQLTIVERFSAAESPASGANGPSRRYDQYNRAIVLGANTTPIADAVPVDLSTVIASGPTPTDWDLTGVPAARNVNELIDLSGKKLVALLLAAPAENAGVVSIGPEGANGYDLFGDGVVIDVAPGESVLKIFSGANSSHAAVAAGAKDIRISGAAEDALQVLAQFGSDVE